MPTSVPAMPLSPGRPSSSGNSGTGGVTAALPGPARSIAGNHELSEFHRKRQKVMEAERTLSELPAKWSKEWDKMTKSANSDLWDAR